MKIAVIGAGKWGQALFFVLSENNDCVITSRRKRDIENFVSIEEAIKSELLIFSIGAQNVSSWLKDNFVDFGQKILIASKGIEIDSGKFLNEIFESFISKDRICCISGPSFASEVIQKLPCALVASSSNEELSKKISMIFPRYIKVYSSTDVIGAEICGAYKNVIAIASGICDGLSLGNNARASLMSRGLIEIHRFGKFFGAKDETFLGLSGAGDLFLTASSNLSRNYRVGYLLAEGKKLSDILEEIGEIAEGVYTSKAILDIATKYHIYTPIATEVASILNGKNVKDSLYDLLKKK